MNAEGKAIEIFYVDDQKIDRVLFEITLAEIGTPSILKMAKDGQEAMQVLNEEEDYMPDLIILDLKMPFKNGNECLEEIRKIEKFKLTPVILFSNSTEEKDINQAYENNANLYVQKPFNVDHQVALMKKLFSLNWNEYFPHPAPEKFVLKP